MKGKKYTMEEWEAAKSLKKCGFTWKEVCEKLGRGSDTLGRAISKYNSYEEYLASYKRVKKGQRRTEQLQFLPPEAPKPPKKIFVKNAPSEDDFTKYKLKMANRQAIAIRNFIVELRNAGINVKLG